MKDTTIVVTIVIKTVSLHCDIWLIISALKFAPIRTLSPKINGTWNQRATSRCYRTARNRLANNQMPKSFPIKRVLAG